MKKKIGILVNSIGFGGNERSAVNIANALADRFKITIIVQEDCGNHYEFQGNLIYLNTPCASSTVGKVLNSCRRIIKLRKITKALNLDALLIILPVSNPINYIHLGCKKIVSCRDCGDLIRRSKQYIRMTENSALIVCNSKYQATFLRKAKPAIQDKVRAIYNIIDVNKIQQLKLEKCDDIFLEFIEGHRCFISAGRFVKAKGLNNLIKAFFLLAKEDPEVRLIMIGDGELHHDIVRLIHDLNIDDLVLLMGFQDNPFKYIFNSDAFILPSLYEGFPNTLIEAMACAKPVIAMNCPSGPAEIMQVNEILEKNMVTETGILVPYISEKESTWEADDVGVAHHVLADAMKTILEDQCLAERLSKNALLRAEDFSAEKILVEWEKLF